MAGKHKARRQGSAKSVCPALPEDELKELSEKATYYCYKKHKPPKGWGSICPKAITQEEAEAMIKAAFARNSFGPLIGNGWPKFVWYYSEAYGCYFEAKPGGERPTDFHGYPVESVEDVPFKIRKIYGK